MGQGLQGKRALVTGATRGIGLATAKAFLEAGAEVRGLDLSPVDGHGFGIIETDVACEAAVERGVAKAVRDLGGLDILVNSAGVEIRSSLARLDIAALDRMYAVNVRGTVLVTRAALDHFREGGRVINIASDLAYLGRADSSGYAASKGAVVSLTRSWAREFGPRVLVNAVAPGPTDTPFLGFESLPAELQALELANPLARIGRPEEIAAAVVFLAGPGASFMTGQCLGADGGAAMR